jgi:hypothetical protein
MCKMSEGKQKWEFKSPKRRWNTAVEIQILVRKGTIKNKKMGREMCLETSESTDWKKERTVNVKSKDSN